MCDRAANRKSSLIVTIFTSVTIAVIKMFPQMPAIPDRKLLNRFDHPFPQARVA